MVAGLFIAELAGARLARVAHLIEGDTFLANYCDGLSDIDLDALVRFHASHGKIGTITGCPVNTVKTRMFHARAKLRAALPALANEP